MRAAPDFWGKPPGLVADLLLPIGVAWDMAGRLRRASARPYRAPVPVVCVGNLVAGGAGKTPVVLALCAYLVGRGVDAHVVTRGYGGRLRGPVRVGPACHDASDVGDEALLLARRVPCWVARDRAAGVRAAVAAGAGVILLDDGFQNPTVAKTLSLITVDADYGFGNGRVIPAGPLRENLRGGLARADAMVLIGREANPDSAERTGVPVVRAQLAAVEGERLAGLRLVAFAGIGRPQKFFALLRAQGADLVGTQAFADHHPFCIAEIEALRRKADRAQAQLITTAKDFVRMPAALRRGIELLEVEIRWLDPAEPAELMMPVIQAADGNGRDLAEHHR
jgi:tetraacyldisaccharide 4'-kinase